jgi:AcrR family transcriptional regulator
MAAKATRTRTRRAPARPRAGGRRERERQSREQDILSAAERVFARHGYHAAAMTEIAREADYAVGSLYKFFDSKEALFERLSLERAGALERTIVAAIESAESAPAQLETLALEQARYAGRERAFFSLFISSIPGACQTVGFALPDTEAILLRIHERILGVVERGVRRGELGQGLRPQVMTLMFEAATRSYNLERIIKGNGKVDEPELRAVVRALLLGMTS